MNDASRQPSRREAIKLGLLAGAGMALGRAPSLSAFSPAGFDLMTRPIPQTGEQIPVVGVGTNAFGVQGEDDIAARREVIRTLVDGGGRLIDTARGYGGGRAEQVIGRIIREIGARDRVFIATKANAGNASRADAIGMLEASLNALGVDRVAAIRVHNLAGTDVLFPVLREWKQAGRIRYFGVSTSSDRQYPDLERLIRQEELDIVEVDFSVVNRTAADRILPLCQDHGVAVMNNVPFGGRRGNVLAQVASQRLPDFAAEIGANSWAQLCLKYNLSNPAITAVIPGTTQARHMADNLGAARGGLPDAGMRRRIEQIFDALI